MKIAFTKALLLVPTLLVSLAPQAHGSLSKVKGFELINCNNQKKCIKLNSQGAESGTLTPIMTLRDYKLEITTKDTTRLIKGPFAYYDLQENKIVLSTDTGKEIDLNLKDLSEQEF